MMAKAGFFGSVHVRVMANGYVLSVGGRDYEAVAIADTYVFETMDALLTFLRERLTQPTE